MNACGNTPPVQIKSERSSLIPSTLTITWLILFLNPDKDVWIGKERLRWARYFSVPMIESTPEGFPPLTLATERALCAVSVKSPGKLIPTIEALYHSFWVQGNAKIGQVEGFTPVLESVLGKDGTQEILQAVRDFWTSI